MRRPRLNYWLRFTAVSLAGVPVQTGILAFLLRVIGLHYLPASVVAVEGAVLHNFVFHKLWTWADRPGVANSGCWSMLMRFHLTNGISSLGATLLLMPLLVEGARLGPVSANLIAIAICSLLSLVNFVLSDRLVFTDRLGGRPPV